MSFHSYVQDYDESDPKTHKGLDLNRMTMAELYKHYDLTEDTQDFIGHALALHVSAAWGGAWGHGAGGRGAGRLGGG